MENKSIVHYSETLENFSINKTAYQKYVKKW